VSGGAARVALITGSTGELGSAIARRLAGEGWAVVRSDDGSGRGTRINVRDADEVDRWVREAATRHGRIDLAVHCAATDANGPIEDVEVEAWWLAVDTRVSGAYHLARAAAPHLTRARGSLIFVASEWGVSGQAHESANSAGAAATIGLTKALAREFAPHVRVNCLAPGVLAPASPDPRTYPGLPVSVIVPPTDDIVAGSVSFLASPAGAAYNGQVLHPNGGATLA
jgi:NAD(P)-dependent dehydrogenase (short-subunit alcohol dehydrogenase family)